MFFLGNNSHNTGLVDGKDEAEIRWRMGSLFEPCSISSERVERAEGDGSSARSDVAAARLSKVSIRRIWDGTSEG